MSCCDYNFLWLAFPRTLSLNHPSTPCISAHSVCTLQLATMVCMYVQAGWRTLVVLFFNWVHAWLSTNCSWCCTAPRVSGRASARGEQAWMLTGKLDVHPTAYEIIGVGAQPTWPCSHPWLKTLLLPSQSCTAALPFKAGLCCLWWVTMCWVPLAPGTADCSLTIRSCKCHQAGI